MMKCHTCDKELIPPNYKVTGTGDFCCSSECYNKAIGAHLPLLPSKEANQTTDGYPNQEAVDKPAKTHDPVNHPAHYTSHPSGVECITITRHMTFNIGNVIKYVWRSGLKGEAPAVQDLKKAAFYLNDEIKRIENDPTTR